MGGNISCWRWFTSPSALGVSVGGARVGARVMVDSRRGKGFRLINGAVGLEGTLGDEAGVVMTPKIDAIFLMASIFSVPRDGNGDAGEGLESAVISSCAADVAVSAEDVAGIVVLWGGNSTDQDICSALVLEM